MLLALVLNLPLCRYNHLSEPNAQDSKPPSSSPSAQAEVEEQEPKAVTFSWGLIMIRTKKLLRFLDNLARYRIFSDIGWVYIGITIAAGLFMIWLMLDEIYVVLNSSLQFRCAIGAAPAAQCHANNFVTGAQPSLTSYLLLPGINQYIPVLYGIIGIVVAIVVHEGTHGLIARRLKLPVKSTGLLFFLIVPIGAFVEIDEKLIQKLRARDSARIMAGGPGSNVIVGAISLLLLILLLGSLVPAAFNGVYISQIVSPSPANNLHNAGHLQAGDVITAINQTQVSSEVDLTNYLSNTRPGDTVLLRIDHQGQSATYPLTLGEYPAVYSYNSCFSSTPASAATCSFGTSLVGNSSLVIAIASLSSSSSSSLNILTPKDSLGTTFSSPAGEVVSGQGSQQTAVAIFQGNQSLGGGDTVTVDFNAPSSYQITLYALLHARLVSGNLTATSSGTSTQPTPPSISATPLSSKIIIGIATVYSTGTLGSLGPGSNYTMTYAAGSNNSRFASQYTQNASGSEVSPFTLGASSTGDWHWSESSIAYDTIGFIGISPVSTSTLNSIRDSYTSAFTRLPSGPLIYLVVPGIVPQAETIVPFSGTLHSLYTSSVLGSAWYPIALTLFWIFFININLAFFNAIPLYPLDGGQAIMNWFSHFGKKRVESRAKLLTTICSVVMLILILSFLFLPRILAAVPF